MTQFKVTLEQEICCEFCNEVIRFDLEECPVCHASPAPTNQWCSVFECIQDRDGQFRCEGCKAKFKILSWDDPVAEVEFLGVAQFESVVKGKRPPRFLS